MMKNLLRSLLPLLFLGLLAGCSVYENIVHPRRLPTPDMAPQAKAKYKAAEKARHKGMVLKSEEPVTNATDPNAAAGSEAKKDGKLSYSELPEGTKIKYDKEGLIKNKPKLKRLQYHHYDTRPLTHNDVNRENRKMRKSSAKGKGKGSDKGDLAPKTRADQPVADTPPPPAPEEKAEKAPKEKKKKDKKAPKPDPTLEQNGN
jgi:uncharacterized short protein YbdD (DUF466 family)